MGIITKPRTSLQLAPVCACEFVISFGLCEPRRPCSHHHHQVGLARLRIGGSERVWQDGERFWLVQSEKRPSRCEDKHIICIRKQYRSHTQLQRPKSPLLLLPMPRPRRQVKFGAGNKINCDNNKSNLNPKTTTTTNSELGLFVRRQSCQVESQRHSHANVSVSVSLFVCLHYSFARKTRVGWILTLVALYSRGDICARFFSMFEAIRSAWLVRLAVCCCWTSR